MPFFMCVGHDINMVAIDNHGYLLPPIPNHKNLVVMLWVK